MGMKCAALNCRSGYRPTKWEKAMIERKETPPCKKHVFSFPKKAEIRAQWLAAIRRQAIGWNPDNFGICELHFKPQDYVPRLAPRTMTKRQRVRLKPNAIPTVFDNYPETAGPMVEEEHHTSQAPPSACWSHEEQLLNNQTDDFFEEELKDQTEEFFKEELKDQSEESFEEELKDQTEEFFKEELKDQSEESFEEQLKDQTEESFEEELKEQTEEFFEEEDITDLDDLYNKLSSEVLPSGFRPVMMQLPGGGKVISIRIEEVDEVTGLPTIVNNVTVYANASFVMHTNGLQLSVRKVADITAKLGHFCTVDEVVNVLARVKDLTTDTRDQLEAAATILDTLTQQRVEDEVRLVATFAAEQLRLVSRSRRSRRYSPFLLGNAVIWNRTSPKLYQAMHNSALFCLPHPRTLRRLTSALQPKSGLDSATMTYLGMRVGKLEPSERLVNLAMDEVHTAQSVELAGGRVCGKPAGITKTLFCAHINSVASKYEDLISMFPVAKVTREDMEENFNKVLKGLTELGYKVVSVTTGNHHTNHGWQHLLGYDSRHPEYIVNPYSEDEERVYTLYDTVHIFRNLFYGLLRNKTLVVPPFPGSENPRQLRVDFSHLARLYNMEQGHPGRLANKLTDQILKPSAWESVSVGFAAAATHDTTSKALRYFAEHVPDCKDFVDTAEFLELVRRWFNTCNVKSRYVTRQFSDKNRVELCSGCEDSEKSLKFLSDFGSFMRNWHESKGSDSVKLAKETRMAVFYTSRGLVSLTRYLFEKYNGILDCVLLGKIQSQRIEEHFGQLRKLAGGNYWASIRQFMENEAVIRTNSLLWWSGYSTAKVSSSMGPSQQNHELEDMKVVKELVEVVNQAESEEMDSSTKAALGYIAGYLAHSTTRNDKCGACTDLLVDREAAPLQIRFEERQIKPVEAIYRSMMEVLDNGKLPAPSSTAIDITRDICHIWRWLVKEETSRHELLGCDQPRNMFIQVMNMVASEDAQLTGASCSEGHNLVDKLVRQMAGALFDLFAGNMMRNVSCNVHAKRKTGVAAGSDIWTQGADKRCKVTGVKKR